MLSSDFPQRPHVSRYKPILHHKPILIVLLLLLGLLPLSQFGGGCYVAHLERSWPQSIVAHERSIKTEISEKFTLYQEAVAGPITGLTQSANIKSLLSRSDDSSMAALQQVLSQYSDKNLSIEVRDTNNRVIAWSGELGSRLDIEPDVRPTSSIIVEGPIYSYYVHMQRFSTGGGGRWTLIGKRMFDVNYPIKNRFISSDAFAATFAAELPDGSDFSMEHEADAGGDSISFRVALKSPDGQELGYVDVSRPTLVAQLDHARGINAIAGNLILLCIVIIVLFHISRVVRVAGSFTVRIVVLSLGIWAIRFAMLWTEFPASVFSGGIFDATIYASPFGFGLAQSVGDFLVSSVFLLINVLTIGSLVYHTWAQNESDRKIAPAVYLVVARLLIFLGLCFLPSVFLRGYVSVIRSAVFDSSLLYNDPTFVIPSFGLAVMLTGLFVLAVAVVVGSSVAVSGGVNMVSGITMLRSRPWAMTLGAVLVVGVLYGSAQANPLLDQWHRVTYLLLFWLTALWFRRSTVSVGKPVPFRIIAFVFLGAVLLLVPILDREVHELDRTHVELVANEITRPTNSWMQILLTQTLDGLSGAEAASTLESGTWESKSKLAFTQWAKSMLSREGNNCSVVYFDTHGRAMSTFEIGMSRQRVEHDSIDDVGKQQYIDLDMESADPSIRWHRGYSPITSRTGDLVGGVRLELSSSRQLGVRGSAPEFLKNYTKEHFESQHRMLVINEYSGNRLVSSSDESVPLGRQLPKQLVSAKPMSVGEWIDEQPEEGGEETFFLPLSGEAAPQEWISFSMPSLDIQWHLYSFLRYLLFFLILFGVASSAYILFLIKRKSYSRSRFRIRLLAAFVIVSLIPIVVVALYNRAYVADRTRVETVKNLTEQTSLVVAALERQYGVTTPASLTQLDDDQCARVADQLDTDFSVYGRRDLLATSKPEMVMAELLDNRLSAMAYNEIVLQKKRFVAEDQSIGRLPYVVGYRPIRSMDGSVIGVVSVPTLYKQEEVAEELTRRNLFLFGAYALALVLSIGAGTLFANQISSPIVRLKQATKEIARGKLHLSLRSGRKDEIGELEAAFEDMSRQLERTQAEMVQAQRELAWKEMAKQVAHEIKNPLTPIKLSIQHLRRAYDDNSKEFSTLLHQVTATVLEQIDALSRIASEFSRFARMPDRNLTECHLHDVLKEACSLFEQESGVRFEFELIRSQDSVLADHDELRRMFINIIRNGVQAMDGRGTINIRTSLKESMLMVRIADDGPGIQDEIRERLFEPNFSTKTDGMGLGLAIVKKTIDDLGGKIEVETSIGNGTTFIVSLPRLEARGGASA